LQVLHKFSFAISAFLEGKMEIRTCLPWFLVNKRWFPKTASLRDQPEDLGTYCFIVWIESKKCKNRDRTHVGSL